MQFKAVFITAAVASLAAASPAPRDTCSTGALQCCNSVQSASNPAISLLTGLLGIVLPSLNLDVGLGCSPLSIIGLGGGACSAQAVCCEDNSSSLISIGCLPIQL
ncbi:hypothetical protein D9757_010336 [Collybiopsis confluens]|uniref:Hydrophobin n=1 Tax=Collybiopsis confluens TaxID=2823264 RepID=A0A8H5C972_9AGAR|nr:hypothetical protein D9757_015087 [Collybiopsis confluens]KAF5367833.1 hypothetical protein D9757_010336 [Collybiopsis confluens]